MLMVSLDLLFFHKFFPNETRGIGVSFLPKHLNKRRCGLLGGAGRRWRDALSLAVTPLFIMSHIQGEQTRGGDHSVQETAQRTTLARPGRVGPSSLLSCRVKYVRISSVNSFGVVLVFLSIQFQLLADVVSLQASRAAWAHTALPPSTTAASSGSRSCSSSGRRISVGR